MRTQVNTLPVGIATFGLGMGVAAITFLALASDNVSNARTQWFALLAFALSTPAIFIFLFNRFEPNPWWKVFWSAGYLAYLLHFYWAIVFSFNGEISAILERQGLVAYSNFIVTALWTIDVALIWMVTTASKPLKMFHVVTWVTVTISFVVAAGFFRSGVVSLAGYGVASGVISVMIFRALHLSVKNAST